MHNDDAHHERKGPHWRHHGRQQTRRRWILKERSGGEWWFLMISLCFQTELLSVAPGGFPTCTRQTRQQEGLAVLDLRGKKSIFSPPGFLSLTCILTGYFCRHYDSSTYNPVTKVEAQTLFSPLFGGLTGHPCEYVSDQATDLSSSKHN